MAQGYNNLSRLRIFDHVIRWMYSVAGFTLKIRDSFGLPVEVHQAKIAIVSPAAIGDFIMALKAMVLVRRNLPSAKIIILARGGSISNEIGGMFQVGDKYICFKSSMSFSEKARSVVSLINFGPDIVVNLEPENFRYTALCILLSAPKKRIGITRVGTWNSVQSPIYNVNIDSEKNEMDRYVAAVKPLLSKHQWEDHHLFSIRMPNINNLTLGLNRHLPQDSNNGILIAIQPGSSSHQKWKRWPEDKYRDLVKRLVQSNIGLVVLIGSMEERNLCGRIAGLNKKSVYNLAGQLGIGETIALIQKSAIVICNDSSGMHLAALVGVSAIVIYGPTDPARTKPRIQSILGIRSGISCSPCFSPDNSENAENCPINYRCLTEIEPQLVFKKITNILLRK